MLEAQAAKENAKKALLVQDIESEEKIKNKIDFVDYPNNEYKWETANFENEIMRSEFDYTKEELPLFNLFDDNNNGATPSSMTGLQLSQKGPPALPGTLYNIDDKQRQEPPKTSVPL